jgi:asparagine synthase (glutamine-hydrolysing)
VCGICGVANADSREFVDPIVLERMRDAMTHRGPDDAGLHLDREIGIASRRLAIIDPVGGRQPLANQNQSIWIVFNGAAYNHVELQRDYLDGRFPAPTNSDTEVILRLYELFQEECVKYLNGMFAFAIWDQNKRQLFIARDRLGIKPLYYTVQNGSLIFASEIKSILRHPKVNVSVNVRAIDEFMTYGYVNAGETLFSRIHKLPGGHSLTWRGGRIAIKPYWDLNFQPNENISEGEHAERISQLLEDSVRLRLRADFPIGLFLSGGVDSTVIAGLLSRLGANLKTFSIGFDAGKDYNELSYARIAAKRFGTDHHESILSPEDFLSFFPRFINHIEEPVTDAAAIPLYFLSREAAGHVKVVLSGEGSDELFAGYPIYRYMAIIEQYRRLPRLLRRTVLDRLLRMWPSAKMDKYIYLSGLPIEQRYLNVNLYDVRLREDIYNSDFRGLLGDFDPIAAVGDVYRRSEGWEPLSRLMYLDTKSWLPNDILIKADRMSMAASIELRTPYLDYRLAEYAASVPARFKIRLGKTKYILKKTFADLIPKPILRRKKMGFAVPLAEMFRGALKPYVQDVLFDGGKSSVPYLNSSFIRRVLDKHLKSEADNHQILWRVLILREWHRQFKSLPAIVSFFVAGAQSLV